jgi:hypothetical protein
VRGAAPGFRASVVYPPWPLPPGLSRAVVAGAPGPVEPLQLGGHDLQVLLSEVRVSAIFRRVLALLRRSGLARR